ncbi:MAG: hypothetical protein CMH98_00925 [Oceanospirillaceae bacterium]|nr:hypothetical protein [Oceanospirillaceae bacterium]
MIVKSQYLCQEPDTIDQFWKTTITDQMTALKTSLGKTAVKDSTPVPAFEYLEISDFAVIKANLYYAYAAYFLAFFSPSFLHANISGFLLLFVQFSSQIPRFGQIGL